MDPVDRIVRTSAHSSPVESMNTRTESVPQAANETPMTLFDRLFRLAFFAALGFLCVVYGLILGALKTTPYYWTEDALTAFNAICSQQEMFADEFPSALWELSRYDSSEQRPLSPSAGNSGYTLYTSGAGAEVFLIDHAGQPVHSWHAPFSQVWKNAALMKWIIPDERVFVRRAHIFPNGDLLALYETPLNTPNGMGFAKLDRDSNVIWEFDGNCHHDFALHEDGTIFVLTHELKASEHPLSIFGHQVNIEDFLTVLSQDGKLIKQFSLLDAFYDSPLYRHNILQREHTGDLLHANTVNLVPASFAAHHAGVSEGDLMICFRNVNLVAVINPQSEQIVWTSSGPWHFPHDPDPLDNGNLLIFDNIVCDGLQAHSRVVEYDPRTKQVVWSFNGDEQTVLRSDIRSTQQRLDNGNTLICESDGGRMLEVDSQGRIVWEFVNPVRGGEHKQLIPIMAGVTRYQPTQVPFVNRQVAIATDTP